MTEFSCDHTFRTNISPVKFEAVVVQACRARFAIELIGHDPGLVPAVRLFLVSFATAEDRDRVRIAMRFLEKEQTVAGTATVRKPALAGQLANAS